MRTPEHQRLPDGTHVRFTDEAREAMRSKPGFKAMLPTPGNGPDAVYTADFLHDVILRETGERWGTDWLEPAAPPGSADVRRPRGVADEGDQTSSNPSPSTSESPTPTPKPTHQPASPPAEPADLTWLWITLGITAAVGILSVGILLTVMLTKRLRRASRAEAESASLRRSVRTSRTPGMTGPPGTRR